MIRPVVPWLAAVGIGGAIGCVVAAVAWQENRRASLLGPSGPPPRANAAPAWTGDRPNVVVVIGCTVRRDQVSGYGGADAATPFLAELAAAGVRFDGALAAAPWTRAAAGSLLTGQPFRSIGLASTEGPGNARRLAAEVITLADVFHEAGYWTVGATAHPDLDAAYGFAQGFDRYHGVADLWREGMTRIPASAVVDRSLRDVDRRDVRDAPVYLQVLLSDARPRGAVPEAEVASFADDRSPQRVHRYRALLHRLDNGVRRLWNGLEARGFTDENTVFVFVGDHGEGLAWPPDQGNGHGNFLVPSVLEMPWIVRGRGVGAGVEIAGLASGVDLFPTLAGLVGVAGYTGPGQDWSGLLANGGTTTRALAFADTDHERSNKAAVYAPETACEANLRFASPVLRCFDRREDPFHRNAVPSPDPALASALVAWRGEQDAAAAAWPWTADAALSAEARARFEQLGYLKAEPEEPEPEP